MSEKVLAPSTACTLVEWENCCSLSMGCAFDELGKPVLLYGGLSDLSGWKTGALDDVR